MTVLPSSVVQQREKRAQFDNVFIDLSIHKQELREKEKRERTRRRRRKTKKNKKIKTTPVGILKDRMIRLRYRGGSRRLIVWLENHLYNSPLKRI